MFFYIKLVVFFLALQGTTASIQNEFKLENAIPPISEFVVIVHNKKAHPLFQLRESASTALGTLAEDGDASALVEQYGNVKSRGVDQSSIGVLSNEGPLTRFYSLSFDVEVSRRFPYVSFTSMPNSTNDCFVDVNACELYPDMSLTIPRYNSGTEQNNELSGFIPGPFCLIIDSNKKAAGNGERGKIENGGLQGEIAASRRQRTIMHPSSRKEAHLPP
ncbi:predicted protein [Phaeodactylum tricornutum CCAP 1055/1]|uniref:Spondin domain-containing protein n=2 Tax=Phaeodactylum tricornutum TaxID=2850 RepID=B7G4P0_PHATC|nr:predicted protein [Phaeodactylum tricornutum CCAP 1055/1]EEC46648.1 predicted protein [Phaeodactylum tricornutum CCAP 1055/1]|eukprot:XP_002182108.1 predicted protein [Phaeodactylum tricornutum CCAP 1055/1]